MLPDRVSNSVTIKLDLKIQPIRNDRSCFNVDIEHIHKHKKQLIHTITCENEKKKVKKQLLSFKSSLHFSKEAKTTVIKNWEYTVNICAQKHVHRCILIELLPPRKKLWHMYLWNAISEIAQTLTKVSKCLGWMHYLHCQHASGHIFKCVAATHLTLKTPVMIAADDIYKYFFIVFQRK